MPDEKFPLPESDEKLLAECDVYTFRSSGKGGQHVNTTNSAVRLRHRPTGITVTSQQERSQHRNKAICLARLRRKIEALNEEPTPRIPTRVPRSAKVKTREQKARHARKKQLRSRPRPDRED